MPLACQSSANLFWTPAEGGQRLPRKVNIVRTISDIRALVALWREEGHVIALVPTMGALHEGHCALVREACENASRVIISIFVNPTQFAAHEDLGAYPRQTESDVEKVERVGGHSIYVPKEEDMYPPDFSTKIIVGGVSEGLCGLARPHFFSGVAIVVTKLFLQVVPDIAVFGEKDYQQLLVVRQLVRDLNIPIRILSSPIIREKDGLAWSSRNIYLNVQERSKAPLLYKTISSIAHEIAGGLQIDNALKTGRLQLESAGLRVEYLEVRDSNNLSSICELGDNSARVFVAARLGRTRLIDNVAI